MSPPAESHDAVIAATRHWLTEAVIGLNLCPFAKAVHVKGQIRYAVSNAENMEGVLTDLEAEIQTLVAASPETVDTTLLVLPRALGDFLDYNDCLFFAERMIKQLRLEGIIQIASFHPHYQFEGVSPTILRIIRIGRLIRFFTCFARTALNAQCRRFPIRKRFMNGIRRRFGESVLKAGII